MKIFGFSFGGSSQKKLMSELNEYLKHAEEHPDDIRVHLRIAEVLMKMGERHKAIDEYIKAAEEYEANNLSQISAAIYKQILQIDPDQINTYHTLVDIHLKEGFLGDAIATYERLASHYYDRGMENEVVKTLEKMVNLDPKNVHLKDKVARFYSKREIESRSEEIQSSIKSWELFHPVTVDKEHSKNLHNLKVKDFMTWKLHYKMN